MTLDDSDYKQKIEKAKEDGKKLAKDSKDTTKASALGWLAVATAVVAVINKVKDLIVSTAQYADQIGDIAQKWGFTTQQIQEFDYWATMSGTTLESLLTGMRGLVNQAEAGAGAFAKLGVSVKNADGSLKDQRTLFLETIDALQKVENQTERNALQFEIFGRAGIELGQVINRNAEELNALSREAENLGIILSDEAIAQAGEFNDKIDQIKLSFKGAMAEMFAGTPEANEKFEAFLDNIEERIKEWMPKFVEIFSKLLVRLVETLVRMLPELVGTFTDALMEVNWFEVGWNIIKAILKGAWEGIKNSFLVTIGKGWLWGTDEDSNSADLSTTTTAISTINNVGSLEKTEKIDETLDITLRVEGDGTAVSEQNLNIVSDLVVGKINEILGGEV